MGLVADHYLSIGRNCEVGFQLKRVLGFEESNFFSWNVTYLAPLLRLIRDDFAQAGNSGNWITSGHPSLLHDSFYDYGFHWIGPDARSFADNPDLIAEQIAKNAYLIEKFRSVMRGDKFKVLFHITKETNPKPKVIQLREALLAFGAVSFHLVIIQAEDRREVDWHEDRISNRYLPRLAPDEDAMDGHVDGWDAIFQEFSHRKPLRLAWRQTPSHEPQASSPPSVQQSSPKWWSRWPSQKRSLHSGR